MHVYEVRPRKDHRGVDLISDVLPFGRLWYAKSHAVTIAINYAKFFSRSRNAVIRVYDESNNVIETNEHAGGVQRTVRIASTYRVSVWTTVCNTLPVPFTTLYPIFLAVLAVLFATLAAVWTGPA